MFHCFVFFPCVVSWCGFSKGFLSNQCATQPLSPVGHSQGLRLKWYDQLCQKLDRAETLAVLSDEYARFGATNGRPGSLPASSQDFSVPCWQDLAPDFMTPSLLAYPGYSGLLQNFHEQKLHKTYPPFPKRFLLCSQVSLCRVPVAFQIVDSQVAEPT